MKTQIPSLLIAGLLLMVGQSENLLAAQSSTKVDSVDQSSTTRKSRNVGQLLFSGLAITGRDSATTLFVPSAFELVQYNTVEGLVLNPWVSFTKKLGRNRFVSIRPNLRYGTGNQRPQGQLSALYYYRAERFASIELAGGRFVRQINDVASLGGFGSTWNALIGGQNFLKLYQTSFLSATHRFAPVKDFLWTNQMEWNDRTPLQNLQKIQDDPGGFTPNTPETEELKSTTFQAHQALHVRTQLRWQLLHRYYRKYGRFVSESKHPAVTVSYRAALPEGLGADVSFQQLSVQLEDHYSLGLLGKGQLMVEAGDFLSTDSVSFLDFTHFNGNQSVYNSFDRNGFQLLDYYRYSTVGRYVQAHWQHRTPEVNLGKRPLTLHPVASANFLHTGSVDFLELGIGLERIRKHWRVDVYSGMSNGRFTTTAVRFGYQPGW